MLSPRRDAGYTGMLIARARAIFAWTAKVVQRAELHQFAVLPKRSRR